MNPQKINLSSWSEFVEFVTTQFEGRWHFRGCLGNHRLESTLERACSHWGIPLAELPNIELLLLRDFKRAFPPRAEVEQPAREDDLDWLALMQHHGAPTRLLDFTYSPFVAAFFAFEMLLRTPASDSLAAAIWALSGRPTSNDAIKGMVPQGELRTHFEKYSAERVGISFRKVFLEAEPRLLLATPVNPYRLNERLIVQQGLFICPGNITMPFEANFEAVPGADDPSNLKKILLQRSVLPDAFTNLRRMNISAASLFPGIDGYARSQHHIIDFLRTVPLFKGTVY